MAVERLYIENTYIPLSQGLNPSITKAITDVSEPEKRKATYTKTVSIPRSKEADKIFSALFEVNLIDHTFNVQRKASCLYTVDDDIILRGYLKLNEIRVTDTNDIVYDVTMNSDTANFWERIRTGYLRDLYDTGATDYNALYEGLDKYDHTFAEEIQAYSWATQVWYDGAFIPFDYGTGYVYPLIDYGYSSDATNFTVGQMPCAIYVREYLKKIISWAGFEYDSSWIDGTVCEHLIIPASPANYALTTSEISDRQFVANTPKFASNSTTKTANLTKNAYGSNDQLIFTNDSVAPGTDPGLNYDPATGVFTCVSAGYYDINILCDLQGEFKPGTANNVKTRCEIDGYLLLTHTPNGSAVETQINAVPFYITYDDSAGFISGTRTTQSSPTYPETDYLESKVWSVYPNLTPLVARPYAVPNRYHLVVNNIYLIPGDEIRAYHKTGVFAKKGTFGTGYPTLDFFADSGGTYYLGDAKLMCSVGAFYTKCVNTSMAWGNTLLMEKIIPDNVKMMDFFTSILKMFNLWVDIDPLHPFTLIVEQRETYYGSTVLNIHELIDRGKEMTHIPMGSLDVKSFYFKYKPDNDYWNKRYETSYSGEVYGNREVLTTTDWYTQEKMTEVIFSPTPSVGLPNQDRVLPTIYQLTDTNTPISTKHNIRILWYGGLKSCAQTWNHIHYMQGWPYLPLTDTYSTYPYAGHFDDPFNPTQDINFGLVKEVYYDDNLQTINPTDGNLVNLYHSDFLNSVTDEDSRIVRAYVHLTPAMYKQFTFDKLYYFDYAYFRLQKIEGYNPTSEETTFCEFLKLTSIAGFTSTTYTATGAPTATNPISGPGVDLSEHIPVKSVQSSQQPDGNNIVPKSANVIGEGNTVWSGAKQVQINGYGNIVESNVVNVKIQGDNNTIQAGVENVTLINTSDITVSESNVTYIDGKLQGNWPTMTADFTTDVIYEGYFIDCAGGDVDVTVSDREEKAIWTFKRIDTSGNVLTITPTGLTVDGMASFTLLPYECITIKWNNDLEEFSIVD